MRHQLAPASAIALLSDLCFEQAEVGRLPVAADDPASVQVLDRVLVAALARQKDAKRERRVRRIGVPDFGGLGALGHDQEEAAVLGGGDAGVETEIVLLVDERVARRIGAQHVPPDPVTEQGHGILLDIQDARAVGVPGEIGFDVRDRVRQRLPRGEILEAQGVLSPPDRVVDVSEQPVVRRDGVLADRVVPVAAAELVGVQHHLLGRLERAGLARVDRVLLSALVARVVPVAALSVRDGRIVLLDAGNGLLVHAVCQRAGVRRHGRRVRILGLEVAEHRLVGAGVVPQPVVLVDAGAVRRQHRERSSLGDRWRRRGRRLAGSVARLRRDARTAEQPGHRQYHEAHEHGSAIHRSVLSPAGDHRMSSLLQAG